MKKSDRKIKTIRVSFFLLLLILFAHLFFSMRFSEPYPAILLPSFSNVPENDQQFRYRVADITAYSGNRKVEIPSEKVLFNTMPPVYSSIVARRIFSQRSYLFSNTENRAIFIPDIDTSHHDAKRDSHDEHQKYQETAQYLLESLKQYSGYSTVDSLLFTYHDIHRDFESEKTDTVRSQNFKLLFSE